MPTMNQIVDTVLAEIQGSATVDPSTYLTAGVTASATSFLVADATNFSRGIIGINNELIFIDSVDKATNTLTCGNVSGRGIRGTDAATHALGDRVVMNPSIPRSRAVDAVEETLTSSTGLFAVTTTSFVRLASVYGYSMPAAAETVLDVSWMPSGDSNDYLSVRRWNYDRYAGQIVLYDLIEPGTTVTVTYTFSPTMPSDLSSDFSETGLPNSCVDVIRFGAAWRLSSFIEPGNLLAKRAEANAVGDQRSMTPRLRVSEYLYGMYRTRLLEEVTNLQRLYPIKVHFGR